MRKEIVHQGQNSALKANARTVSRQERGAIESAGVNFPRRLSSAAKEDTSAWLTLSVTAICGSIGALIVIFATPWGIGVTTDSTVYIGVARNFLKGYGFFHAPGAPLTHYPPLYPFALSLSNLIGLDPLDGARWIQAILFGMTVSLSGLILYRETGGLTIAVVVGLLFLLSSSTMTYIYSFAWSEGLFIFFTLAGFLALGEYIEKSKFPILVTSSIFIGFAFLTRYIGICSVVSGCLCILLLSRLDSSKKYIAVTVFCTISLLPISIWIIRNRLLAGTLTNRAVTNHPVSHEHVNEAVSTFSSWLFMPQEWPVYVREALLICFVAICLTGYAFLLRDHVRAKDGIQHNRTLYFPSLSIMFVIVYILFLIISISFIDAHTPLDDRILSPLYPVIIIGVLCLFHRLSTTHMKDDHRSIAFVCISILCIVSQLNSTIPLISSLHYKGTGFTGKHWKYSNLIGIVKSLPNNSIIYTNGPDAIDILTGKSSKMLPSKSNPSTLLTNDTFPSELAEVIRYINSGEAVLVYFNMITWRWYLPSREELIGNLNARVLYQGWDGIVCGMR